MTEGTRPTLSLILPVFNEEEMIPELEKRLKAFVDDLGVPTEVLFVNDGSKDRSLEMLKGLVERDSRFKVLSFSRNFGHQIAITAGVDRAIGEAVVVMDADLQDPPEVVKDMFAKWREGFDVVYGVRKKREGETLFKRFTAAAFYRLLRAMIGLEIPLDTGDFRLMSRKVVLALRALRETHRFVRGMVSWVGFKQTAVYYERPARFAGETKYPLRKMIRFALDGITSFSTMPLRIATWLGVFAGFVGIGASIWAVYEKLFGSGTIQGWTTIMIAVSLGSAAQLLMTGILGEYVGRVYEEVKRRPLYLVGDEINLQPPERD